MTARRRTRKVGLKRIDAALDALSPMGFSRGLVRRTVNKLLKAYGAGDQGWPFIEEASYKLVIDAILEEQEQAEMEDSAPKLLEYSESKVESIVESNSPIEDKSPCNDYRSLADMIAKYCSKDEASQKEVTSQHIHSKAQTPMEFTPYLTRDSLDYKVVADNCSPLLYADIASSDMSAVDPRSIRGRKPCFGWISSDDDDDDEQDLVCLTPAK